MKTPLFILLLLAVFAGSSCTESNSDTTEETQAATADREYYQLKVYTFETDEQVSVTDDYLKDAYLPGLKKLGIDDIGVFKLRPSETDSTKKTFVLVPFSTIDQFLTIEEELTKDEAYQAAGEAYLSASQENPPYQRIETTLMQAFTEMPKMEPTPLDNPRSERIYELRSYESPTERHYKSKVEMFNAGGEVKLFDRLNFNAVFYAEVLAGSKMPNLMYMTTFPDRPTRDTLWNAFFTSPEWEALKVIPKYQKTVSHSDIMFLYPTDYSDY